MVMRLLGILTGIFKARGYEILVSSDENGYLLLRKNGSTLAVGYSDPGQAPTVDEIRMFISMAEGADADSMLFISPEKMKREQKRILDEAKAATWDRMALAIAIGEQSLMSEGGVEGPREADLFDPDRIMKAHEISDGASTGGHGGEGMETERGGTDDAAETIPSGGPGKTEREKELVVKKLTFPEEKEREARHKVSEEVLLNVWSISEESAGDGGKTEGKRNEGDDTHAEKEVTDEKEEPAIIPFDMPIFDEKGEEEETHKDPWQGSILAPSRCSREEACQKAGVPPDTELQLEHAPYLLVGVSYALRSETGERVPRSGHYLYDPTTSGLLDIPGTVAEELRSTLAVWNGEREQLGAGNVPEDDRRHIRALKDRLSRETHSEDRLVRETLMSTIYQEVRYLFDPSSFDIRWSRKVVIPFWVKKDVDGRKKWMVDAYLGRYIPLGTGQQ